MSDPRVRVSLSDNEKAELTEASEVSGVSISDLLKVAYFTSDRVKVRPRPTADRVALAQVIGNLGRVGNNINQIAHHLNAGTIPPSAELILAMKSAREELTEIGNQVKTALGVKEA